MKVQVLPEAEFDLVEGHDFYERQSPGLGSRFIRCLYEDIDSLQKFAGIHARERGFQRMLAKRFPFAIYYRLDEDVVSVFAVVDCRRDPEWIAKRLS